MSGGGGCFRRCCGRSSMGMTRRRGVVDLMQACDGEDSLLQAQYVDVNTYLVGDILTKVDRTSMAHSLEVRAPFLDHELLAWGMSLPPALKLRGQEGKWLLKKALEPKVPKEILYRRKQGFCDVVGAAVPAGGGRVAGAAVNGGDGG